MLWFCFLGCLAYNGARVAYRSIRQGWVMTKFSIRGVVIRTECPPLFWINVALYVGVSVGSAVTLVLAVSSLHWIATATWLEFLISDKHPVFLLVIPFGCWFTFFWADRIASGAESPFSPGRRP